MNLERQSAQTDGLSVFAQSYPALLCDIWGVLHNGIAAYPAAIDALQRYRAQGGRVVLVSNASRPSPYIKIMLDRMNVPHDAYDGIVTSGDATRDLVAQFTGQIVHHVGPRTDDPLFEGINVTMGSPNEAAAIVVTGLNDPDHTPNDYTADMDAWLSRGLPLICANPDKVVEIGDRIEYCPGALADIYGARGGDVRMAGKPFAAIYRAALAQLEHVAGRVFQKSDILAVGDSVRTDATGAARFGIDFLFVTGSIHAEEINAFDAPDKAAIEALVAPSGARMVAFMPRLVW